MAPGARYGSLGSSSLEVDTLDSSVTGMATFRARDWGQRLTEVSRGYGSLRGWVRMVRAR